MIRSFSKAERLLFLLTAFSSVLVLIRISFSMQLIYLFYAWNFILAAVPLLISRRLMVSTNVGIKAVLLLFCWLLFFPNAAYIVTDILHFAERPPVPKWFDLLIVISSAWNGLMFTVLSLLQVETFLLRHYSRKKVTLFIVISLIASAFGIYVGRFLRFNSWDIITDAGSLFTAISERVLSPFDHRRTWGFTLLFGTFISLVYFTVRELKGIQLLEERKLH